MQPPFQGSFIVNFVVLFWVNVYVLPHKSQPSLKWWLFWGKEAQQWVSSQEKHSLKAFLLQVHKHLKDLKITVQINNERALEDSQSAFDANKALETFCFQSWTD